ncbi:MAG: hypothetical protein ACLFV7_09060 [Phycisphaerae bacterium]
MVRIAAVMLILASVAVGLVHIRREQTVAAHEIQRLQRRRVILRRELSDRMVRVGGLTSPDQVIRRTRNLALDLPVEGAEEPTVAEWNGD